MSKPKILIEKRHVKKDFIAYLAGTNRQVWESGATAQIARDKLKERICSDAKNRQPTPPVRCAIQHVASGHRTTYDKTNHTFFITKPTIFPSHRQAKDALWHICQSLPPKVRVGEADRYIIIKGV